MNLKYKKIKVYLVIAIIIFSCGYNVYQYNKINNYKEKLNYIVSKSIGHFASSSNNIDDEVIYAEKYANIDTAQKAYAALNNNGILSEEWSSSLPGLFVEIKRIMFNDKNKFKRAFEGVEASILMYKISNNFNDKDSINKVYKLLEE